MADLNAQQIYLAGKCETQQKQIDELRSQVNLLLVECARVGPGVERFGAWAPCENPIFIQQDKIKKTAKEMREKAGEEILGKMAKDALKTENAKTAETVLNKFPTGITGADLIKELISQGVQLP